jgi:hypothetical protein
MRKSVIAILMTSVILVSFMGPLIYSQMNVLAASPLPDPTSWYQEVDGVLATDYYSLYPYNASSIKLGFSKYGELIDNNTNVGLEYAGARDPFAPTAGFDVDPYGKLPKKVWINGWFIDITYNHSSWGLRNLWAGALYGDLSSYGKPWLRVENSYGSCTYEYQESFLKPGLEVNATTGDLVANATLNYGGRKTNGTAITEPIEVLYHGPRKFVAKLVNHLYDWDEATNTTMHIVDVTFTIIFNKVKKEIIVLKEVKIVDQAKYQISSLKVIATVEGANGPVLQQIDVPFGVLCQFSNREEWDMGVATLTPKYASYVHFYTEGTAPNDTVVEGLTTVYDTYWTVLPTLPANVSVVDQYTNVSAFGPNPVDTNCDEAYDVAQIISNDKKYVGFAGYWPALSDWSADAGGGRRDLWWRAMSALDAHDIDAFTYPNDEPFLSPLTVGEWDFMLSDDHRIIEAAGIVADIQFRGVTVYGVTDVHNADDYNEGYGHRNVIDKEVYYQLNEVFNPWDLQQAIDKDTMRWVQKEYGDGETTDFMLEYSYMFPARPYIDDCWPYVDAGDFQGSYAYYNATTDHWQLKWIDWDSYCTFTERVLVDGVLQKRDIDYTLWTNATILGVNATLHYKWDGFMWINFTTEPDEDAEIKILFSTCDAPYDGSWEWGIVGKESQPIDSLGLGMATEFVSLYSWAPVKMTGFDMQDLAYGPDAPYIMSRFTAGAGKAAYRDNITTYNLGRTGFQDDWSCHVTEDGWVNGIPVASSNIIAVGGPSANLASEYFNDFTDAFATLWQWTPDPGNAGKIMPLTCWSRNEYDTNDVFHAYVPEYDGLGNQVIGYGVISTYKDINGTVGLTIWGYTGQDTYYTAWSMLHSDVLYLAMEEMKCGVTSLILRFNYTLHPTDYCFVTIVEALGTISELDFQAYLENYPTAQPDKLLGTRDLLLDGNPFDWPDTWITDKFPRIHLDP